MPSFSFDIDPYKVLGVTSEASLQEIREAYRAKTKKYHPDVGGEDWTFRILSQAYELLSTNRVMRATHAEAPRPRPAAPVGGHHDRHAHDRHGPHRPEPKSESVYAGIIDKQTPAHRRAAVEVLSVRYLWDQASYLWLNQKSSEDDRFLSCSVNVSWPDRGQGDGQGPGQTAAAEESEILASLSEVFDHLVLETRAVSSRCHAGEDGFSGWLTYTNFDRTWKAVRMLQERLHARNLGMRQWSRDLFIPKNWS
ncbi:J domain-containing protein [Paludisphaera mucosa]|uniref:J domain-containing protein n=1 Tax=Paludisphaera mucosa TaxID=3030827 RepID=A0ABT6FFY6_9BACT|nr:J domain-containing protein [Paludisphaera mucosa]MDG3006487.1 J domain-containing protein [Paludisphaera mucosa]